jgi:uncharacterized protein DUF2637
MSGQRVAGRGWGYTGAMLGGAVSIAANVAHSYVPPAHAPADWRPPGGAVIGAVFWPVALFVAIEILARTPWRPGWRWVVLRLGGLLPVAVVAAVVSYRHLAGLLKYYREDALTATIGPLAVDGLMVMATAALVATSGRYQPAPPPATSPRTPEDAPARIGVPRKRRTGTRTDADLIAALADVPRDADGTVPVRRAAAALGTGPDRARKLLRAAGLLRGSNPTRTPQERAA